MCALPADYVFPAPVEQYVSVPIAHAEEPPDLSTTSVRRMVLEIAQEHSLNIREFDQTMRCESNYVYNAYNKSEDSAGVAQIHLPAHKEITKEQADDPQWALEWAAKEWETGHQSMWTCFQKIQRPTPPT